MPFRGAFLGPGVAASGLGRSCGARAGARDGIPATRWNWRQPMGPARMRAWPRVRVRAAESDETAASGAEFPLGGLGSGVLRRSIFPGVGGGARDQCTPTLRPGVWCGRWEVHSKSCAAGCPGVWGRIYIGRRDELGVNWNENQRDQVLCCDVLHCTTMPTRSQSTRWLLSRMLWCCGVVRCCMCVKHRVRLCVVSLPVSQSTNASRSNPWTEEEESRG